MPAMKKSEGKRPGTQHRHKLRAARSSTRWLAIIATICAIGPADKGFCADPSDPILNLMLQKGLITEDEAAKVKAEAEAIRTNEASQFPESRFKISPAIKNMEIFGDIRLRFENRSATDPQGNNLDDERLRYALRLGLRGEVYDDFYYGFRVETSANPRSSWVSMGNSSGGPFSKSGAGIDIGQIYLGWQPEKWVDLTVGKMPNPIYTTPMVWDPDINPEGAAEHLKYTVGAADFSVTLAQFLYQDVGPSQSSPGYLGLYAVNSTALPFIMSWQAGVNYHVTKKVAFKVAPVLYTYNHFNTGHAPSGDLNGSFNPDFSGTYVGQGSSFGVNGVQGVSYNLGGPFDGFWANQDGINKLMVLEVPFELNMQMGKVDLRVFGDYAQNLQGADRAQAAYNVSQSSYFSLGGPGFGLIPIPSPQTHDDAAYQIGFAIGSKDSLGLVNGTTAKKHSWEFRTYWQHIEQYALDPNLIDSDAFEGRENMQGINAQFAYGFTDNFIGMVRYAYATRINNRLGTGGSNADLPQMNPINQYDLLQLDLMLKF
jgi:hypothetical protein